MSTQDPITIGFGPGLVENRQSTRVICEIRQGGTRIPALARWNDREAKKWSIFPLKWIPIRLAFLERPAPCNYVLRENGTIGLGYGTYSEESIDNSLEGPKGRGPLRDLQVIGSTLFAAGMSRQVYRREGPGNWQRVDGGVVAPLGELRPSGFTSIAGLAESDFLAVGYLGEIWSCRNGIWTKHESPTNLLLHRVVVVEPTLAYATGQKGLLLRYDGAAWTEVSRDVDMGDLWGAAWFGGALYVASESNVYRLEKDGSLKPVKVEGASSCGHLHANDGVLWSFGSKDLASTSDGRIWRRVDPPM
jgi:hypothetical protein